MATEKRLIDANEYKKSVQSAMDKYDGYDALQNRIIQGLMEADDLLDQQPTVEAVEVVHGRWIEKWHRNILGDFPRLHCSECGEDKPKVRGTIKACEWCGTEFVLNNNGQQKYCCAKCRREAFKKLHKKRGETDEQSEYTA